MRVPKTIHDPNFMRAMCVLGAMGGGINALFSASRGELIPFVVWYILALLLFLAMIGYGRDIERGKA